MRVTENATVGTEVLQVLAVDGDTGSNGEVRYRLRRDPLGDFESFSIEPSSGSLTLQLPLDRERQKSYEVTPNTLL